MTRGILRDYCPRTVIRLRMIQGQGNARSSPPSIPTLGIVCYDYASFQADDDPALKLALYTRAE